MLWQRPYIIIRNNVDDSTAQYSSSLQRNHSPSNDTDLQAIIEHQESLVEFSTIPVPLGGSLHGTISECYLSQGHLCSISPVPVVSVSKSRYTSTETEKSCRGA